MLILNTCIFQKKYCLTLTCVLICSLAKCVLEDGSKIFQNLQKYIHHMFAVKEVTTFRVFRVATF